MSGVEQKLGEENPMPLVLSRFRMVESCIDEDCRCDDRAGVVLYDGSDWTEALKALRQFRRPTYHFSIEDFVDGKWKEVFSTSTL